jgi:hypothetical protein
MTSSSFCRRAALHLVENLRRRSEEDPYTTRPWIALPVMGERFHSLEAGRRLVSIEMPPLLVLTIARPLALGILDPPPRKGKG